MCYQDKTRGNEVPRGTWGGLGEVRGGVKERGEDAKALFPCGKQTRPPKILKE